MSTETRLKEGRELLLKVREREKKIIFGKDQAFGIDVATNALLVPTQWEEWNRVVSTMFFIGSPGSGKTTGAEALAVQINAPSTLITGLGDMTPSQLIGHTEFVVSGPHAAIKEEIYREGYIKLGRNIIIFDEILRANRELFNAFAQILAAGRIIVSGRQYDIAPEGEPLVVICTANPLFSSGTREPGDFLVDRIVASAIFRTPWGDDAYLSSLLSPNEHWKSVKAEGLLSPIMTPRDITEIQQIFNEITSTPTRVKEYQMQILRAVIALSRPGWSDRFPVRDLPPRWRAMSHLPSSPLLLELGGRTAQHLSTLARADSFLTYGADKTTCVSTQQMARAVLAHRIMFKLAEGGMDILDQCYQNEVIPFLVDTLDWVVSLVPLPE